ncbi:MAG: 50S ribosomal protein L24 [Candidatus Babeliales bacterium]
MKRLQKGDQVVILTGKDKNKKGSIIEISHEKGKVKIEGLCLVTKHVKARRQGETGGINKIESYIDISNVMPIDPTTNKPVRVNKVQRK